MCGFSSLRIWLRRWDYATYYRPGYVYALGPLRLIFWGWAAPQTLGQGGKRRAERSTVKTLGLKAAWRWTTSNRGDCRRQVQLRQTHPWQERSTGNSSRCLNFPSCFLLDAVSAWVNDVLLSGITSYLFFYFGLHILNKSTHSKRKEGSHRSSSSLYRIKVRRQGQRKPHSSQTRSPCNFGRETVNHRVKAMAGTVLAWFMWVAAGDKGKKPSPPDICSNCKVDTHWLLSGDGGLLRTHKTPETQTLHLHSVNPKSSEPYLTLHAYKRRWGFKVSHTNAVF